MSDPMEVVPECRVPKKDGHQIVNHSAHLTGC